MTYKIGDLRHIQDVIHAKAGDIESARLLCAEAARLLAEDQPVPKDLRGWLAGLLGNLAAGTGPALALPLPPGRPYSRRAAEREQAIRDYFVGLRQHREMLKRERPLWSDIVDEHGARVLSDTALHKVVGKRFGVSPSRVKAIVNGGRVRRNGSA